MPPPLLFHFSGCLLFPHFAAILNISFFSISTAFLYLNPTNTITPAWRYRLHTGLPVTFYLVRKDYLLAAHTNHLISSKSTNEYSKTTVGTTILISTLLLYATCSCSLLSHLQANMKVSRKSCATALCTEIA